MSLPYFQDFSRPHIQEIFPEGLLKKADGPISCAVRGPAFFHADIKKTLDNLVQYFIWCSAQMKSAKDHVDGPVQQRFGMFEDIHDSLVGAAGNDDQSFVVVDNQGLLFDPVSHLSCRENALAELDRFVYCNDPGLIILQLPHKLIRKGDRKINRKIMIDIQNCR